MRAAAWLLVAVAPCAALSVAAGTGRALASEARDGGLGTAGAGSSRHAMASGLRSLPAGALSRLTTLVQQPRFELLAGALVLAALGLFLAWKAYTARKEYGGAEDAALPVTAADIPPAASAPAPANQQLPPLADRFRSLSALRARDQG